jgi:hypothetical protein
MAFSLSNFDKLSTAGIEGVRKIWAYTDTDETLATLAASAYFNDVINSLTVGDSVFMRGSDGVGQYEITSVTTNVTMEAATDPGALSETLSDGNIFVGNGSNIATGVNPSGDIDVTNTGVFSIATGVIVNADVSATAAIAFSKLAALTDGQILVGNGSNVAVDVAVTGDVTISNSGVTAIASDVIVNADVKTDAAIAYSKLAALPSAEILVGNGSNVATAVAVTGDVTITNGGVTAIGAEKVLSSMVSPLLMKYAVVSLSASEFNGMYAAPVVLVAAGGANTLITLHRAELLMTYVSAQYQAGGVVAIQYDDTANGAGIIASTTQAAADFFDAVSTANAFEGGIVKQPFSTCVNKGLYLSNVTQAFTTGDSTFEMHLWYSEVPTV